MARAIAATTRADREQLLEFVRPRHHAILMTTRQDGWDEYRQAMRDQGRSLIRVTVDRWGPIATGGFPARLAD